MNAGRRLLADAAAALADARPETRVVLLLLPQHVEDHAPFFGFVLGVEGGHLARGLELGALVDQQRRVATVVDDQVGAAAVGPDQRLARAPPVLLQGLALPGEHRHAGRALGSPVTDDHGRGGVILRGEDVARDPADVGAEIGQRLDQDRRLDRHVQAAHHLRAGEGLPGLVFLANRHQAGHLLLGETDLLAAVLGQREVRDLVGLAPGGLGRREGVRLF